ncbi:hypothetical protein SHD_3510 [Shewanella decolorationis S12]|uniref:Uncharacterized protein n=1 Tax=Shewanella decolorationis S12 TaxID=1353536 RepID=A0ABP2YY52_9GAMM|nr:hypothetical protein SHD_3510 [Shewanella decolorationis S12]
MQRTYQLSAKYTIWKNTHARFPNLLTKIQLLYSPDFIAFYFLQIELIRTDIVRKSYQNTQI